VARVQALVGIDGVTVPELRGGRGPADQVGRVAAAAVDVAGPDRAVTTPDRDGAPWPGRLPAPSPAIIWGRGPAVDVLAVDGAAVEVSDRGLLSSTPALLREAVVDGSAREPVERSVASWAGPWPAHERWWDGAGHRNRVRLQLVLDDGVAHLVTREGDVWYLEATYD
jgi:protein ImuB